MSTHPIPFSDRSNWTHTSQPVDEAIASRHKQTLPVYNLTRSSIGQCNFPPLPQETLNALTPPAALDYDPDPQGMRPAREAAADWFNDRGAQVTADDIYLTASTSEAYTWCLRLLTNPGDIVFAPRPSYPLFDLLADLNDVTLKHIDWAYDGKWHLDLDALRNGICDRTRAIIIVSPNNPTGARLSKADQDALCELAAEHGIAILADEVFADYTLDAKTPDISMASNTQALAFTFGGGSKTLGLPQMKIAWMHLSGPEDLRKEAKQRLDIIADTYLSINTPAQLALPTWMDNRHQLQQQVRERLARNLDALKEIAGPDSPYTVYPVAGGWTAVLRVPASPSEEDTVLSLAQDHGVVVHPGSFYGFDYGAHLIVSLLTPTDVFDAGLAAIVEHFQS